MKNAGHFFAFCPPLCNKVLCAVMNKCTKRLYAFISEECGGHFFAFFPSIVQQVMNECKTCLYAFINKCPNVSWCMICSHSHSKKITFFWKVLLLQQCAVQQAHGRNVRGVHGPDTAASGASDHISSKGKGRNLQAAHNQLEIPCCIECFMPTAITTFFCVQRAAGEV